MVDLLKINGVVLDNPSPAPPFILSKKEMDLDSGRNLKGIMQRTVLEHHPRTLTLKFPAGMNEIQMKNLLEVLDKPELDVECFDPFTADKTVAKMYHGDLTPSIQIYIEGRIQYDEFSVELVEY